MKIKYENRIMGSLAIWTIQFWKLVVSEGQRKSDKLH